MANISNFKLIYFTILVNMRRKISDRFPIYFLTIVIFSTMTGVHCIAQDYTTKRPPVTSDISIYKRQVTADSTKRMVALSAMIPRLAYDLRYTGTNNFMKRRLYPEETHETFLRLPVVQALARVQRKLNEKGYGLKIFDAYRPWSVTVKLWELVKDERYVANPAKGSGHNRGVAVDLTLISLQTGEELDMGIGFDNFSDTAHHSFKRLPQTVRQNRLLLKNSMEKNGFKALDTEWWHYLFASWSRFELLDIEFSQLKNL